MKNVNMISTCFHETKENKKVVTEVQKKVFFKKKVKQILKHEKHEFMLKKHTLQRTPVAQTDKVEWCNYEDLNAWSAFLPG